MFIFKHKNCLVEIRLFKERRYLTEENGFQTMQDIVFNNFKLYELGR